MMTHTDLDSSLLELSTQRTKGQNGLMANSQSSETWRFPDENDRKGVTPSDQPDKAAPDTFDVKSDNSLHENSSPNTIDVDVHARNSSVLPVSVHASSRTPSQLVGGGTSDAVDGTKDISDDTTTSECTSRASSALRSVNGRSSENGSISTGSSNSTLEEIMNMNSPLLYQGIECLLFTERLKVFIKTDAHLI